MELDSSDDEARCNLGMCIQQQLAIEIDYEITYAHIPIS